MQNPKHIVLLTTPNVTMLNLAGPAEVFAKASDFLISTNKNNESGYQIHCISTDGSSTIQTSTGIPMVCEGGVESVNYVPDTILVTGRVRSSGQTTDNTLNWLKDQSTQVRRIGSTCAGAFTLAGLGILDGKRATTHWAVCDELAKCYPKIQMEKDPIFVKDGNIYTSAGISAGIDLSLALVEEDYGREVALLVSRQLVLFLKRPGNQSQFSNLLLCQNVDHAPIQKLLEWLADHFSEPLTVETMSERVAMSPRNFARVFLKETGETPAKFIEKLRVENARRRLEESRLSVEEIAIQCGVGNAETLRKMFLRHFMTTPTDYRKRFASALN